MLKQLLISLLAFSVPTLVIITSAVAQQSVENQNVEFSKNNWQLSDSSYHSRSKTQGGSLRSTESTRDDLDASTEPLARLSQMLILEKGQEISTELFKRNFDQSKYDYSKIAVIIDGAEIQKLTKKADIACIIRID